MFGATLSPTGNLLTPPTSLYLATSGTIAEVLGITGDCTRIGDSVVVAVLREAGFDSFAYSLVSTDVRGTAPSVFFQSDGFIAAALHQFLIAPVGDSYWFIHGEGPNALQQAPASVRIAFDAVGAQPSTLRLHLPVLPSTHLFATELFPGDGGAWYTAVMNTGTFLSWLTPTTMPDSWIPLPEPMSSGAYALAVRGTDLAMAFQLDTTTWRIWWISAPVTDADGTVHAGTTVRGPTVTLDAGVFRPGGTEDGDQLIFAGAQDSRHVTIWSVPWGQPDGTVEHVVGSVEKLSTITARRLGVVRIGDQYVAVWTEVVPATSTGASQYTALLTSSFPANP